MRKSGVLYPPPNPFPPPQCSNNENHTPLPSKSRHQNKALVERNRCNIMEIKIRLTKADILPGSVLGYHTA
ncbi:hypothetical protein vseg_007054 [Gypsophila vaccaria]